MHKKISETREDATSRTRRDSRLGTWISDWWDEEEERATWVILATYMSKDNAHVERPLGDSASFQLLALIVFEMKCVMCACGDKRSLAMNHNSWSKTPHTSHSAPDFSLASSLSSWSSPHHPQVVGRRTHELSSAPGHLTHCWAYTPNALGHELTTGMMVDMGSQSKAVDDTCGCRQHVLEVYYSVPKPTRPDQRPSRVIKERYCQRTAMTVLPMSNRTQLATRPRHHKHKAHRHRWGHIRQ